MLKVRFPDFYRPFLHDLVIFSPSDRCSRSRLLFATRTVPLGQSIYRLAPTRREIFMLPSTLRTAQVVRAIVVTIVCAAADKHLGCTAAYRSHGAFFG